MRPKSLLHFKVLLALFLIELFVDASMVSAQKTDGFTLQKTPGLALVKPQPWSKPDDATVMEFEAFIDRTSTGGANSGYYEFHTNNGDKCQIASGRVVKIVVYPDSTQIKKMIVPEDREKVQAAVEELTEAMHNLPAPGVRLTLSLKTLEGELKKFDSGQIKNEGTWLPRVEFIHDQSDKLVRLLEEDINTADPPDSFDLTIDAKYIALVEYSQSDPLLQPKVNELLANYTALVRKENRVRQLALLADPKLAPTQATAAVKLLRTLRPEDDPASAAYLQAWDASFDTVKTSRAEADTLALKLESEMAAVTAANLPPQLSPLLASGLGNLNQTMLTLKGTTPSPPPPLLTEAGKAMIVCTVGEGLKNWITFFSENQFLQAQDLLSKISAQTVQIGPETTRAVGEMQKVTTLKVDEFIRLREQAKLLADSGKTAEALPAYEKAYAVIPDSTVSEEIERLKKKLAPPKATAPPITTALEETVPPAQ